MKDRDLRPRNLRPGPALPVWAVVCVVAAAIVGGVLAAWWKMP